MAYLNFIGGPLDGMENVRFSYLPYEWRHPVINLKLNFQPEPEITMQNHPYHKYELISKSDENG